MSKPAECDGEVFAHGAWGSVLGLGLDDGSIPSREYFDSLVPQAQAQFDVRVSHLATKGRIHNEQQFHPLEHDSRPRVFEIKLSPGPGHRFYCVQSGRVWVVTHGGVKPKKKGLYTVEIQRCHRLLTESRKGNS